MLQKLRRRWLFLAVLALVIGGLAAVTVFVVIPRRESREAEAPPPKPEAPPDLKKQRESFLAGMQAMQHDDGAEAVRHFSSFTFGIRRVEEYRLYYLGNSYQLTGNNDAARTTLDSARKAVRFELPLTIHDEEFLNWARLYIEDGRKIDPNFAVDPVMLDKVLGDLYKTWEQAFRTIAPGQAPHINIIVFMRGLLVHAYTRLYFDDEASANSEDEILNSVPTDRRHTLIAKREQQAGGVVYRFDIHMQGQDETVFFDV